MLVGFVSGALYEKLLNKNGRVFLSSLITGVVGSVLHSVLVLGGIVIFFAGPYSDAMGNGIWALIGTTLLINSIPEAIVTPIITAAVVKPVSMIKH